MDEERRLTELFAKLGARNPGTWARSQVEEGTPQLARFLFLRQAWRLLVDKHDRSWIAICHESGSSGGPGAVVGPALDRLVALGVNEADLTTVVRAMQWKILSGLCYLLDDPGDVEEEVRDIAWHLFQVNEDDEPIATIGGLHESVLETEPRY